MVVVLVTNGLPLKSCVRLGMLSNFAKNADRNLGIVHVLTVENTVAIRTLPFFFRTLSVVYVTKASINAIMMVRTQNPQGENIPHPRSRC